MRTINKRPNEIMQISSSANASKFFNQLEFKGIQEDNNLYAIDQESCRDAQNMYINFNERFCSRPTLQREPLPEIMQGADYFGYNLVEIQYFGSNQVYVFLNTANNKFTIVYLPESREFYKELEPVDNYHLSAVDHYIICFNNVNAKVIDVAIQDVTDNTGWRPLSDNAYIPITQITTGGSTKESEKSNAFIGQTKHEYIWSNNSQPDMSSEGNKPAEVTVITPNGEQPTYELSNANKDTDYRVIKKTNCLFNHNDLISISSNGGIICIGNTISFKVSFNNGERFDEYYYPLYEGTFCNIAKVSDDGQYFFFVTTVGVYRCNLSDFTWSSVNKPFIETGTQLDTMFVNSRNELAYFKDGTTYSFITYDSTTVKISACVNGVLRNFDRAIDSLNDLQPIKNYINVTDNYGNTNYFENRFSITYNNEQNIYCITYIGPNVNTFDNLTILTLFVIDNFVNWLLFVAGTINNVKFAKQIINNSNSICSFETSPNTFRVDLDCLLGKIISGASGVWYRDYISIITTYNGSYSSTVSVNLNNQINANDELAYIVNDVTAISMIGAYIIKRTDGYLYVKSYINNQWYHINSTGLSMFSFGDNYYFVKNENGKYRIYTNKLNVYSTSQEDIAQIIYTNGSVGTYTTVPQVSYSDVNMYLGLNNLLQITQNIADGSTVQFYLPNSDDQTFIDNITGMINISTTEIALFFKDKIKICAKVQDENISTGYKYDYYNTKLSVGIRLGDSLINTLEGSYTLFPTRRGLAAMNYQAFMSTTDQIVEYISDKIPAHWAKFYDTSDKVKIMQWRNYIVLTNGLGDMLLYDLTKNAWWRWDIPVNNYLCYTDHERLYTIDNGLFVFKDQKELTLRETEVESRRYFDLSETQPNGIPIDWYVISQPLHFKAPNHYKNIKQLVFQFYDIDEEYVYDKTLDAQIKLYRKKLTVREPETVDFKIQGLRTFVKRFNYWKINELQYALSNDTDTANPAQFEVDGISVKYEIGDEVR